jgi:hypothetical protein
MAGQNAENLLDMGDDDVTATSTPAPTGLAATGLADFAPVSAPPPGAKSANPLDDLMELFGSAGLGPSTAPPAPVTSPVPMMHGPAGGMASLNGFGSPSPPTVPRAAPPAQQEANLLDDLF